MLSWVVPVEISKEDRGEEQMKMINKLKNVEKCFTNQGYNLEIGNFREISTPKFFHHLGVLWTKNRLLGHPNFSPCGSERALVAPSS